MKLGYIGLGTLGAPIARRLARCGFDLIACDISPKALEAFDEPGCERSPDPIATATACDALGICVRTDAQLEALTGDGTLFAALGPGGVVMLNSTVSPDLARKLAAMAESASVHFVDVGNSGGEPLALAGKLSLFVGASEEALEKARPLLEALGTVSHLGPPGRGQEGKLLNNLISIANYGMSAAILDLGEKLNFDRDQLRDALMAGSAQSFALRVVPGLIQPAGRGGHGLEALHDLLEKDVIHAGKLLGGEDPSLAALIAASRHMLDRLKEEAAKTEA